MLGLVGNCRAVQRSVCRLYQSLSFRAVRRFLRRIKVAADALLDLTEDYIALNDMF